MNVVGESLTSTSRNFVTWMRSYTAKLAKEVFTENKTSVRAAPPASAAR